jgi:hypothetical protein
VKVTLAYGELATKFNFEWHTSSVGLPIQPLLHTELMGKECLIQAQLWFN